MLYTALHAMLYAMVHAMPHAKLYGLMPKLGRHSAEPEVDIVSLSNGKLTGNVLDTPKTRCRAEDPDRPTKSFRALIDSATASSNSLPVITVASLTASAR